MMCTFNAVCVVLLALFGTVFSRKLLTDSFFLRDCLGREREGDRVRG